MANKKSLVILCGNPGTGRIITNLAMDFVIGNYFASGWWI